MSDQPNEPTSVKAAGYGFYTFTAEEFNDQLGDTYEVEKILGQGGMGAVYKGTRVSDGLAVAIKMLPAEIASLEKSESGFGFVERFEREAQAMARLDHPNIIKVYEYGVTNSGTHFFTMEFVEGHDLHYYIKEGRLTQGHAFSWLTQICEALAYAHKEGIVHRDIKPANIMIDDEGRVKLADFGLVKVIGSDSLLSLNTNVAMGTPEFTAPEIIDQDGIGDNRADIYSVGVLAYQFLTARLPRGVWKAPSALVPGLDPRLDVVLERALNAAPDDRYPCISEMGDELVKIATTKYVPEEESEEPAAAPTQKPAKSKAPALIGGLVGLGVILLGAIFFFNNSKKETVNN
ncbi:MAG: serine/threonine-protein kinase, partial [Verrucomicrobiota bacterium]